jgi:hypothetical protein
MQAIVQPEHDSMKAIQLYASMAGLLYLLFATLPGFVHFSASG